MRFGCFASTPLLVVVALILGGDGARSANACGWGPPTMAELTTFDPSVAGEAPDVALEYDVNTYGVGARCSECERRAMQADWDRYFSGQVDTANWEQALFHAREVDLKALQRCILRGGEAPTMLRPINVTVQRQPELRELVSSALSYLLHARQVERIAQLSTVMSPESEQQLLKTLVQAQTAAAAKNDAFMLQRYAFLRLRTTFYARHWQEVQQMLASMPELYGPSTDLAWRARHYLAGALRHSGDIAGSNLELARIHVGSPLLAGITASDFRPLEDADWKAALERAGDDHTRTLLWRMAGIKLDAFAAAREIYRLDPSSTFLSLLLVRELARLESSDGQPSEYAELEKFAARVANTPRADRPWLMDLVSGHLAAKRGDVMTARRRLTRARAARPHDAKVRNQARGSLALALAHRGDIRSSKLEALADAMLGIDEPFTRRYSITSEVRGNLATVFKQRGRLVEAEFLAPDRYPAPWHDLRFIDRMIARTEKNDTAFDRFLLTATHTRASLEQEAALRSIFAGRFDDAAKRLRQHALRSERLPSDPFLTHVKDCIECDRGTAGNGGKGWSSYTLAERLRELQRQALGTGDMAAQASLELGTALYNLTRHGNTRSIARDTHQSTWDTRAAAHWYQRAYWLATDRELKARAAFYSAKAERGHRFAKGGSTLTARGELPLPTTWFPVVKTFADTQYHREILAECGTYRHWLTHGAGAESKP